MLKFISTILKPFALVSLLLAFSACSTISQTPEFDPKTCLEQVPKSAKGLKIIQGPRTEQIIAADMHPTFCNGQVLLRNMNNEGKAVNAGTITFRVAVEYTGEVASVSVVKTEIVSNDFVQKVADMIMDSDFTPWARHDENAEFIYPMTFTHWWK